jgi:hypothetical protein
MPWTRSITGTDSGNYQNYIGLPERIWETTLQLVEDKKNKHYEFLHGT